MAFLSNLVGLCMVTYAYWTHQWNNLPMFQPWQSSWTESAEYGSCRLASGMSELTQQPGCEDVQISYRHQLAFTVVGNRHFNTEPHKFIGIYVHSTDDLAKLPIKLPLENSAPHGLGIVDKDDDTVRIFITSHVGHSDGSREEVIVLDYSVSEKRVVQELRIENAVNGAISNLDPITNDVSPISPTSYVVSHFCAVTDPRIMEPVYKSTLKLTMFAIVEFNDDPSHDGPRIMSTEVSDRLVQTANGIYYRDGKVYLTDSMGASLTVYNIDNVNQPISTVDLTPVIVDNIDFDIHGNLIVAGGLNTPMDRTTKKLDLNSPTFWSGGSDIGSDSGLIRRVILRIRNAETANPDIHVLHMDHELFSSAAAVINDSLIFLGSPDGPLEICELKP